MHGPACSTSPSARTQSCASPCTPAPLYEPPPLHFVSSIRCVPLHTEGEHGPSWGGEEGVLIPLACSWEGVEHAARVGGAQQYRAWHIVGWDGWVERAGTYWRPQLVHGRCCGMAGGNKEGEPEKGWAGPAVPSFHLEGGRSGEVGCGTAKAEGATSCPSCVQESEVWRRGRD
jgi:hypothetical protein